MLRFYPERAQRLEVEGEAMFECSVNAKGVLSPCRVVAEAPSGYGFGEAALNLAKLFRMKPISKEGAQVDGGLVRIPLRFKLPPTLTPASSSPTPGRRV